MAREQVPDLADAEQERIAVCLIWSQWLDRVVRSQRIGGPLDGLLPPEDDGEMINGRHVAYQIPKLVWALAMGIPCDRGAVETCIRRAVAFTRRRLNRHGHLDLNGFYEPVNVGFALPGLLHSLEFAERQTDLAWRDIARELEEICTRGTSAVLAGQVSTANHRWDAMVAPLACAWRRWRDPRLLAAIDAYLADGIDVDADGMWFWERSPNYANVSLIGLLEAYDCLQRDDLLEPAVRAARCALDFTDPDGAADASFSYRQDRNSLSAIPLQYEVARRMALLTGDGRFTTMAAHAWSARPGGFDRPTLPRELMIHPGPLPRPVPLEGSVDRFLAASRLARIRDGETAITLSGYRDGHFFDAVQDQFGGRRRNEDFLRLRHGPIVIESIRLGAAGHGHAQLTELRRRGVRNWELEGRGDGWVQEQHFRPGRPQVRHGGGRTTRVACQYAEGLLSLEIDDRDDGRSAFACILFHVRGGCFLDVGGSLIPLAGGTRTVLAAGGSMLLRHGPAWMRIDGIPDPQHDQQLVLRSSIPSPHLERTCACLMVPIRLPYRCTLSIAMGSGDAPPRRQPSAASDPGIRNEQSIATTGASDP